MQPIHNLVNLNFNEKVIRVVHRHWFVFFKKILKFILLVCLGVGGYFILINFFPDTLSAYPNRIFLIMALSLYALFIWLTLFYDWINYWLDIWIITNEEIIDVNQAGLFDHQVSRQPLERVQDVSAESKGMAQTFLHFGNVYVQTAGTKEKFIFKKIPNPYKIADKINDLVEHKIDLNK